MRQNEIRLLILLKDLEIGGIETSTIRLVNNIKDKLNLIGIWSADGILSKNISSSKKIKFFLRKYKLLSLLSWPLNMLFLYRIVSKNKFNIIHYHFRVFIPFIYLIKIFCSSIKIVYTHHNFFNDFITKFIVADIFIGISKTTCNELSKYKKNNILISHGISSKNFNFTPNCHEVRTIGFVGRFAKTKGIFLLLNSYIDLLKFAPQINLVLIGDGVLRPRINSFIKDHHLERKIVLKKPDLQVESVFFDIDLLVVPSVSHEGFGLVIIEAFSQNIPVVVSDLAAFQEIVIDGQNGLVFKLKQPTTLTSSIKKLIDNPYLVKNIVNSAHSTVVQKYPAASFYEKHLSIYS